MLIQVDEARRHLPELEITLPLLSPRMQREWRNLESINVKDLAFTPIVLQSFSKEEQKQIIFMDINTDHISHTTLMPRPFETDYHRALYSFVQTIMGDLRLVGGQDILFGKLKQFIEGHLFGQRVDLSDLNILRNLSETPVRRLIVETFKRAINNLTVTDRGTTEIKNMIRLSQTRPYLAKDNAFIVSRKSLFSKIVGDSQLELDFAVFLDHCDDVMSFAKNSQAVGFFLDYRNEEGSIAKYFPDFIVKASKSDIWIIELKGREDLEVSHKRERLELYCEDATLQDNNGCVYQSLYIRQEDWEKYRARDFQDLVNIFGK